MENCSTDPYLRQMNDHLHANNLNTAQRPVSKRNTEGGWWDNVDNILPAVGSL